MTINSLEDFLLIKLMEEAAEIQQRAAKYLQFGPTEVQRDTLANNRERLAAECQDFLSIIYLMNITGMGPIDATYSQEAADAKTRKMCRYAEISVREGTMAPEVYNQPLALRPT